MFSSLKGRLATFPFQIVRGDALCLGRVKSQCGDRQWQLPKTLEQGHDLYAVELEGKGCGGRWILEGQRAGVAGTRN